MIPKLINIVRNGFGLFEGLKEVEIENPSPYENFVGILSSRKVIVDSSLNEIG